MFYSLFKIKYLFGGFQFIYKVFPGTGHSYPDQQTAVSFFMEPKFSDDCYNCRPIALMHRPCKGYPKARTLHRQMTYTNSF
jgi:hypothetical protein